MTRWLLLAATLILAGAAPLGAASLERTKVVISYSTPVFGWAPVDVALARRYFQEEGLEPEFILTGSGSKTVAGLVAGSIDFAATAVPSLVEARLKGQDVVALTALSTYGTTAVVRKEIAREKGITEDSPLEKRLAAMKGLRIGTTAPGSGGYRVLALILKHAGLDPERDVQIQPLNSGGAMLAALRAGQIDAICLSSPTTDEAAEQTGAIFLFNLAKGEFEPLKGVQYLTLMARRQYTEQNPNTTAAVARAMAKANRFIAQDKEGTRQILRAVMKGVSDDAFRIGFEANYPAMAKDPVIARAAFEPNYQFVDGATAQTMPYDKAVDTKFATEAKKSLGVK